jgi:hypothetical protein
MKTIIHQGKEIELEDKDFLLIEAIRELTRAIRRLTG